MRAGRALAGARSLQKGEKRQAWNGDRGRGSQAQLYDLQTIKQRKPLVRLEMGEGEWTEGRGSFPAS